MVWVFFVTTLGLICLFNRIRQDEAVNHSKHSLQVHATSGDSRYLLKHAEDLRLLLLEQY